MLFTELSMPSHFEAAPEPVSEDKVAEAVICGPDTSRYVDAIRRAARNGLQPRVPAPSGPRPGRPSSTSTNAEILPEAPGRLPTPRRHQGTRRRAA